MPTFRLFLVCPTYSPVLRGTSGYLTPEFRLSARPEDALSVPEGEVWSQLAFCFRIGGARHKRLERID